MGLLEKSPPLREGINMRSPGLGVPPEATNPVVQVIHRNEKDIRRSCGTGQRGEKPDRNRDENKTHWNSGCIRFLALARKSILHADPASCHPLSPEKEPMEVHQVHQNLISNPLSDLESQVHRELDSLGLPPPQGEVAITAGSRGIDNIVAITRAAGDWLRKNGAIPFLTPCGLSQRRYSGRATFHDQFPRTDRGSYRNGDSVEYGGSPDRRSRDRKSMDGSALLRGLGSSRPQPHQTSYLLLRTRTEPVSYTHLTLPTKRIV